MPAATHWAADLFCPTEQCNTSSNHTTRMVANPERFFKRGIRPVGGGLRLEARGLR